MSTKLTFDDSASEFVIEAFGKEVDSEGYVIDPQTGQRVTSPEGEEVKAEEFGGVEKGSTLFLQDDFASLVEHVKRQRDR